jgi:hypothetical protein
VIWAHVCLLVDIWSMKVFVWMLGRNGELLDSHLFFFDRYSDLADYHRLKGRTATAERLAAIAEAHYQAAPGDDDEPPEAAAMVMPVPRPPLNTIVVSTTRITNWRQRTPPPRAPFDFLPASSRREAERRSKLTPLASPSSWTTRRTCCPLGRRTWRRNCGGSSPRACGN